MRFHFITCNSSIETPRFLKRITLGDVHSASIDITGLGWFVLYINGQRVSDDLFTPAQTDYAPRHTENFSYPIFDKPSYRVLYLHYDISAYLKPGENTVEVLVGNGWYRQRERTAEGEMSYGDSLLCGFRITVCEREDDAPIHFETDGSELVAPYPITESNLFLGETMDSRLLSEPPLWQPVILSDFMPERLELQTCPPDRVICALKPAFVREQEGLKIYDAGKNISGLVKLTVRGRSGSTVRIRYAENLNDDGLDFRSAGGDQIGESGRPQIQCDEFILNGTRQELCPQFVFHGFRYFDIDGDCTLLKAEVLIIHTVAPVTSMFHCDNDTLNWLYNAYIRTQLNNFHGCIPSDCPTRERLGYTGDGWLCCDAAMLLMDCRELYKKWIDDVLDSQDKVTGHIGHTAPLMGGGGGPGGWGCAIVFVPWQHYRHYKDVSILRKCYPAILKWFSYLDAHSEDGLVVREEPGGWCLGDWMSPEKQVLPPEFVNTCFYIVALDTAAIMADILRKPGAVALRKKADRLRTVVSERFMKDGHYFDGVQGADAFALWAKLPENLKLPKFLKERYENAPALDTGIFATDLLLEMLFSHKMPEIAVRLMTLKNEKIGFYYMQRSGATTLFEALHSNIPSNDHPMFGACVRHLFTGLLGIRGDYSPYAGTMIITPCLSTDIHYARGSVMTEKGAVYVEFTVSEKEISLKINLPEDLNAEVQLGLALYPLKSGENHFRLARTNR